MEVNQNKLLCGEETFLDLIKGQNLVKANGSVKKSDDVLSGKKLIILYFSANWCQACTEFTPTLRDFYDYVSSRGVEIIFVSSDGSPEEMFRFMKNSHGNWYAVQYGSDLAKKLTQKYDVWGIQCSSGLVVLSENGSIITKNGRNLVSEMGPEVIYTWSNQISRNRYRYYESQDSSDSDPEDDDNEDICTFTQTQKHSRIRNQLTIGLQKGFAEVLLNFHTCCLFFLFLPQRKQTKMLLVLWPRQI